MNVLLMFAALCLAGEAQARSCTDIYAAIKREAMYCGFFCDFGALQPLQKTYDASCIRLLLPPSPFDLDSLPPDSTPLSGHSEISAKAANSSDEGLPTR